MAATEGLTVLADGNVVIEGAENSYASSYSKETKRRGFTNGFSGGRLSVGYGISEDGEQTSSSDHYYSAALIGSETGDVNIYAGKDAAIRGSQVVAGTGDILLSGENVTIDSQYNISDYTERQWSKKSGLSISVGANGTLGNVISAASSLSEQSRKAGEAKSDRAAALYGIAAARSAYDLGQGLSGMMSQPAASPAGTGQMGSPSAGVTVSLDFSTSKTESEFTAHSVTANGSYLASGGDTVIVARGDEEGNGGDLNIIGSQLAADGKVKLAANNDLNILSAEESSATVSSNKSTEAGASVSYGFGTGGGGWGGSASFSQDKGNGSSESVSHVESIIRGAEGVEFASGNDTLIKGGQIYGQSVVGNVGGNLTIISEQDTGREEYEQSSIGASVSVGSSGNSASFNFQKQKASGNYASVNEQSGIFAGDGGFDITVGGHTGLVGAVIASEAEADKNTLTTASLSVEDIANFSNYSASTKGFGTDMDFDGGKGGLIPGLPMKESGSDSSQTKSAIAQGQINITDAEAQQRITGQTP